MFWNSYSSEDINDEFNGVFLLLIIGVVAVAVWLCAGGFSKELPVSAAGAGTASVYASEPVSSGFSGRGSYLGLGRTLGRAVFRMR